MLKRKKYSNKEILEKLRRDDRKKKKRLVDKKWIFIVFVIAFLISFVMAFISETTIPNVTLILGLVITLIFILLGVFFDIIGVAVTTADEKVFHSMNAKQVKGAAIAVKLKNNAAKVSSICCDVIGDICGVVSGSAGITISVLLTKALSLKALLVTMLVTSIISVLTICGKAIGKSFAINKSNVILYEFSKFISNFYNPKK